MPVCDNMIKIIYNYIKKLLFTPLNELNLFEKMISWILIWPFLIYYIPYKVTIWFKDRKEMNKRTKRFFKDDETH